MLMCLFDVMDDTVAVKKGVFPEIKAELKDIATHHEGRKVCCSFLPNGSFLNPFSVTLRRLVPPRAGHTVS